MWTLNSKIKIGAISFSGVHELEINQSIFSFVQTATLVMPSTMRLNSRSNPKKTKIVDTYSAFKEGDAVSIELAYDDRYHEDFKGFVHRIDQSTPTKILLEGYSYQLRKNKVVNKYWSKTTIKEILQEAIKGTDIKLGYVLDMEVVKFKVYNATGAEIIESLIKDVSRNTLTAFFITPDTLWVGLRYTAYNNTVKYKLGRNVINDERLQIRKTDETDVKVQFVHKDASGKRHRNKAAERLGRKKKFASANVADVDTLNEMAKVKEEQFNYNGLEGEFTTFLEPFVQVGDMALLSDGLYGREQGGYIVESLKTNFGVRGGRRTPGIALKVQ